MWTKLLSEMQEHSRLLVPELGHQKLRPPLGLEKLYEAESIVGVQFPEFLQHLLLKVGNGGFGPGYGLMGIAIPGKGIGVSLEDTYRSHIDWCIECKFDWPNTLVPLIDHGCGILTCLDCSDEKLKLYEFDPNGEMEETDPRWLSDALRLLKQDLFIYLRDWFLELKNGKP